MECHRRTASIASAESSFRVQQLELAQTMRTSAIRIQALVRGHLVRRHFEREMLARCTSLVKSEIQVLSDSMEHYRLTFGERVQAAALSIQRVFRGHVVRQRTKEQLREHRKVWDALRSRCVLTIQRVARSALCREELLSRVQERLVHKRLREIKERLAILTIRKHLATYVAAYRIKKQKIARKKLRRNMRLEAYMQQQKSSRNVTTSQLRDATPRSVKEELPQPEKGLPDDTLDDLSESTEEVVMMQPLARPKLPKSFCSPTAAFLQYSADSVVVRHPPRIGTRKNRWSETVKLPSKRRTVYTTDGRTRGYLRDTRSSQMRYDPSYEFPSVGKPRTASSKPIPESVKRPTQTWLHFSTYRQSLRLELQSRPKEPTWHYTTRSCGLESLPATPLTSARGVHSPGRSDLSTARTVRGRRPLTSEIGPMLEEEETRMRSGLLSMSTLS